MPRLFFLTRGVAGCGKSTFIRENGLEPITISSDKVRLMLSSPVMDADGKNSIDQRKMKRTWDLIYDLIKERFESGATTILDATNLKNKDIKPLRKIASEYRYRVYIIDFTDIPDEEIYRRNAGRDELTRVPEHVIARMLNVARDNPVPDSIPVLTRDEALRLLNEPYITKISEKANALNIVGDIQGCASALAGIMDKIGDADNTIEITAPCGRPDNLETKTIVFKMPRRDEKYVFVGDYLDRGLEHAHVLEYLFAIMDGNYDVVFVEGNHERWIRCWANDDLKGIRNADTVKNTCSLLDIAGVSKKSARKFCSRLAQYVFAETSDGKQILITHGGIARLPRPFAFVSAAEMMFGSGAYDEVGLSAAAWEEHSGRTEYIYQVHGHRNCELPIRVSEHVFCLEGGVEFGGELRAARFEKNGDIVEVAVENDVFLMPPEKIAEDAIAGIGDMKDVIQALRANPHIVEKELGKGVSSFNFSRKAFSKKIWDAQTIRARGLFIDTKHECVKARSYDKFFAVAERDDTRLENLARTMQFPLSAYVKENGYLGICSYDDNETLFCASKSTNSGIFAERFSKILQDTLGDRVTSFSKYLKENNLSAVFEVIDPENDRHIVEYSRPIVVLLSLIKNQMTFEEVCYEDLWRVADDFALEVKMRAAVIETPNELMDWYANVRSYNYHLNLENYDGFGSLDKDEEGYLVEGFVLSDSQGQMVKIKGEWYSFWKFFRGVARDVARRGKSSRLNSDPYISSFSNTPDPMEVYAFLKGELVGRDRNIQEPDIIALRRTWEAEHN